MKDAETEGVLGTPYQTAVLPLASTPLVEVDECDAEEPSHLDKDELIAPPRELPDVWSEPAARRTIGFRVREVLGEDRLDIRINPLPLETNARSFDWLCFGSQREINAWRLSDPLVVQLKQMIPALPFSSPPRKRGSRAASLVPAGLEPALSRP